MEWALGWAIEFFHLHRHNPMPKSPKKKSLRKKKSPDEDGRKWTVGDQRSTLEGLRADYYDFRARTKVAQFWPLMETTFLAKWSPQSLCEQLHLPIDESITGNEPETDMKSPKTSLGKIRRVCHVLLLRLI